MSGGKHLANKMNVGRVPKKRFRQYQQNTVCYFVQITFKIRLILVQYCS